MTLAMRKLWRLKTLSIPTQYVSQLILFHCCKGLAVILPSRISKEIHLVVALLHVPMVSVSFSHLRVMHHRDDLKVDSNILASCKTRLSSLASQGACSSAPFSCFLMKRTIFLLTVRHGVVTISSNSRFESLLM